MTRPDEAVAWEVGVAANTVSMLRARYQRQHFPRHTHDAYVLGVNERGVHRTWHRGAHHVIPAQTLAIVSPGEVHTGEPIHAAAWHYRGAYVPPALFDEIQTLDRQPATPPADFRLLIEDAELTAQFLRWHCRSEQHSDPLGAPSELLCLIAAIVTRHGWSAPRASRAGADESIARRVVDYLHAHLAEPVSLDALASVAGLSRYHVIRVFSRTRGLTPYAYLIQIRIERAKALLRSGQTAAGAAQATGFADQSHLTRTFRRLTGITPARYARAVRG